MDKYIKKYLLAHQKVQVNGLGLFEIVYKSAQIQPVLHTVSIPGNYVVFSENTVTDTTELSHFVASQEHITVEEATNRILQFVENVKDTINQKKEYPLSFGTFLINAMGKMEFISSLDTDISPESFGLEDFTVAVKSAVKTNQQKKVETLQESDKSAKSETVKTLVELEELEELEKTEEKPKPKRKRIGLLTFLFSVLFILLGLGIFCFLYPETVKDYTNKLQSFLFKSEEEQPEKKIEDVSTVNEVEDDEVLTQQTEFQEDTIKEEPKSEPKSEPTTPKETLISTGNYYVIIGSFRSENNAQNFLNQKQNEFPNIVNLGKGSSDLYMIGIGPYSQEDAKNKQKEMPTTWVFVKK